jgi:hypothetical protein
MGILKLLHLNGKSNSDLSNDKLVQPGDSAGDVKKELFVDNSAPEPMAAAKSVDNALKTFLNTDFYLRGYNDGYDNHSDAAFKEIQNSIVHSFIFAVETVISQKKEFISSLKMHIRNIGDSSETDTQIAADKIEEINLVIQELDIEKSHAINNGLPPVEGLVMKAISQHKSGYINGIKAYTEEKFFATSTGLFN